jgi:hypothetical protein
MFHRSFSLLMLQANIQAPCTLLDFPTQDRFICELKEEKRLASGWGYEPAGFYEKSPAALADADAAAPSYPAAKVRNHRHDMA